MFCISCYWLPTHPPFLWLSPCNIAFIPDHSPAVCILASTLSLCSVHIIATPLVCHSLCPFISHIIRMYIIHPDLPAQPLLVDCPWSWRHYNPSRHQELEASILVACHAVSMSHNPDNRILDYTMWQPQQLRGLRLWGGYSATHFGMLWKDCSFTFEPLMREVNTLL